MKKTELIQLLFDAEFPITKTKVIEVIHSVPYNNHSLAQKTFQNNVLSALKHQLPANVLKIMYEYGLDLLIEHFGLEDYYRQKMNDAFYQMDIISGLNWVTNFFNNFQRHLDQIRTDYLIGRKRDALQKLKDELTRLQQIPQEEVMELALKPHRRYIPEYLALVELEIQKCTPNNESSYADIQKSQMKRMQTNLQSHGFFQLPLVAALKDANQKEALVKLLFENELPYQIAMLHFLGFLTHLQEKLHLSKEQVYHFLANVFQANHRAIKGNILVLGNYSNENRDRYTSFRHFEKVESDYKKVEKNVTISH